MKELLIELVRPQNWLFYLFAYGLAAMPTSYWVARIIHRSELEKHLVSSHTASFLWEKVSKGSAFFVLLLDVAKGLLPCAIAYSLDAPTEVITLTGLWAVVGHCFSIVVKFSGGHGGATLAGVLLVISYPAAIATLLTNYLLFVFKWRAGPASMLSATIGLAVVIFLVKNYFVWALVFAMVTVIVVRDRVTVRLN